MITASGQHLDASQSARVDFTSDNDTHSIVLVCYALHHHHYLKLHLTQLDEGKHDHCFSNSCNTCFVTDRSSDPSDSSYEMIIKSFCYEFGKLHNNVKLMAGNLEPWIYIRLCCLQCQKAYGGNRGRFKNVSPLGLNGKGQRSVEVQ